MTILRHHRHLVLGTLAGLFLSLAGASAQVVGISNLAETKTNDFSVDNFQSLGARFTTGTGTWQLTSVDLYASLNVPFPPEANFEVSLYSVSGGLPDQKIVDLTGPNPTGTFATLNYVPATATTLQPSTSYYIVASSPSMDGSYVWGSTTSTSFTGLPGWTLFAGNAANSGSWGLNPGLAAPMVAVNVAAVPEPSPIALAALAFIALAAYRHSTARRA
ncbi:MAG: choice-of-anchor R domain-containing protein [Chthoniobacterales bacterium]